MGLPQPQRVEIHGGSMQPMAHSPKPGRVPLPHETVPAAAHASQPRSMAHRPGYDTPVVRRHHYKLNFTTTTVSCELV